MRTIKQYLEAAKARKENGEAGFSLVELIVVVVESAAAADGQQGDDARAVR